MNGKIKVKHLITIQIKNFNNNLTELKILISKGRAHLFNKKLDLSLFKVHKMEVCQVCHNPQ
jgi:hypothetical protein